MKGTYICLIYPLYPYSLSLYRVYIKGRKSDGPFRPSYHSDVTALGQETSLKWLRAEYL